MNLHFLFVCLVMAASLAGGQLLFKQAAGDVQSRFATSWIEAALSPWLLAALVLYAASTVLWLYILAHVPLSRAYPFVLLGAAMVPLLARFALGEPLPSLYLVGVAVVIGGLAIIQFA